MPRWTLGTIVVAPLGVLLGDGRMANAVDLVRGIFVATVFLMSTWLILGFGRNRRAI